MRLLAHARTPWPRIVHTCNSAVHKGAHFPFQSEIFLLEWCQVYFAVPRFMLGNDWRLSSLSHPPLFLGDGFNCLLWNTIIRALWQHDESSCCVDNTILRSWNCHWHKGLLRLSRGRWGRWWWWRCCCQGGGRPGCWGWRRWWCGWYSCGRRWRSCCCGWRRCIP